MASSSEGATTAIPKTTVHCTLISQFLFLCFGRERIRGIRCQSSVLSLFGTKEN